MLLVCTKCGEEIEVESEDKKPNCCPICYAPPYRLVPQKYDENGKSTVKNTALA